jgi:hypothetical protein
MSTDTWAVAGCAPRISAKTAMAAKRRRAFACHDNGGWRAVIRDDGETGSAGAQSVQTFDKRNHP